MVKKDKFIHAIISAVSVSVLAQVFGLARQILIAAYFGISRSLDIYFMTYAIASLVVFGCGVIFDTISIPHLVKAIECGHGAFKKLTGSIFTFSLAFTLVLSAVFIIVIPIATILMAAGFSTADKYAVWKMALYFLPWTIIFLPYYALCSFFKSVRHFNTVFLGEVVISVFSMISIFLYHPGAHALPIAFFAGYFSAFIMLFAISFRHFDRIGNIFDPAMKKVYRNYIELFGFNQVGSISTVIERYFQSFLPSGGISILAYSNQITVNLSGQLSFRDIFLVPLSATHKRNHKFERAIIGLAMLTVPISLFCAYYSKEIVTLLFKRGKFDISATDLTASVLSIGMLSLLPAVTGVPALRMFQVIDRIKNTGLINLLGAVNFLIFGTLFVFLLKWGVCGLAWTAAINAYVTICLCFYLLSKNGISINMVRIFKYIGYSVAVSLVAIVIMSFLPNLLVWPVGRFLFNAAIYFLLIGMAYLPIREKMAGIIYGQEI
ncbi:MAG TPA: lipid II flippase MurJ [Candidatus Omnitrophota bacterium]|nr:lipid II flippase MurJ [Candidatus Omnitrophota bacterium]